MKFSKSLALAAIGALLAFNVLAATVEINGVKVEDSASVDNVTLQLNGAGTRYKYGIAKVYVAALYLGKKAASPEEVVGQPGPKRLSMHMLRDVDANEFGKLMTRGIEDNAAKGEMSKLIPGLIRMGQIFSEQRKMMNGEVILIDWIPGTGMIVTAKGKVQGEPFKEHEFFKAMMSIWLGQAPADFKLKEALLGNK